jgi:hypothetical protein
MHANEMRERAQRCRTNAAATFDRQSRQDLLELAAEWEALATQQDRVDTERAEVASLQRASGTAAPG